MLLGGRFGYSIFFLFRGEGKEEASEEVAGGPVSIENRGRGVPRRRRRGRGKGAVGVSAGRWGGLIFFCFSGPKCSPRLESITPHHVAS